MRKSQLTKETTSAMFLSQGGHGRILTKHPVQHSDRCPLKRNTIRCKRVLVLIMFVNILLILIACMELQSTRCQYRYVQSSNNSFDREPEAVVTGTAADYKAAVKRQLVLKMRPTLPDTGGEVSCAKLLSGDAAEQMRAIALSNARPVPLDYRNDEFFAGQRCTAIRERFVTESLSAEEASFPLAFSLVVFKDFYQVEKLLRAVYRPEHFYCIHVDSKADNAFFQAVSQYASCFSNVVLAHRRANIEWGRFSVLEAELLCMERLLELSAKWRYFINLTGQEYPLRTMLELVRIVRALNGANSMENAGIRETVLSMEVQLEDCSSAPIQWHKGSVHVTVTRKFVKYALSDFGKQVSEHLRLYARWPTCPDEIFFATLNNNPRILKAPGADKTGLLTDNVKQPFFNRYKNWLMGVFGYPCLSRKIVRQICIWGVRDLPAMDKRFELFVNKFYYNFERFSLQCMEERLWNNTMADYNITGYAKTHQIPLSFYSNFGFVRNHL